jgi:quercetin dioxygenase-like cupin family protein
MAAPTEETMRWMSIIAASIAVWTAFDASATCEVAPQAAGAESFRILLDNARVRVYRTRADVLTGVEHGPAVIISLEDSAGAKPGSAIWVDDAAVPSRTRIGRGTIVIVQPLRPADASPPTSGSKPGEAPFTGMSFNPVFENDRVSVIRARMEVGAREAFHTHASDTVVVHLSGGEIEDTADGKTVVNRWKHGDVEFEGRATSHSARNVGGAVDVVLVALKPR